MTTVQYPESAVSQKPTLRITLPSGWRPATIAGSEMSAIKLKDEGEFAPNILLRIFEDSPTSSLETASQGVSNYIKTLENPTVLTDKTGEINGQRWHVAEFIRRDKTVGDIIQQVATTAIKAPEVTWVYRLTGTALSVNAKTDFTEIRQLLASAVVEETRD